MCAMHCATLALVLDDARGKEFVQSEPISRLQGAQGGSAPTPHNQPRLSDAVLEVAALVVASANDATASCGASIAGQQSHGITGTFAAQQQLECAAVLALNVAHGVVHRQAMANAAVVSLAAAETRSLGSAYASLSSSASGVHLVNCPRLWSSCAAALMLRSKQGSGGEATSSALSARAGAQAGALLAAGCALCHVITSAGATREALLAPVLALRPHMHKLGGDMGVAEDDVVDFRPLVDMQASMSHVAVASTTQVAAESAAAGRGQFLDLFLRSVEETTARLWGTTRDAAHVQCSRTDGAAAAGDGPRLATAAAKAACSRLLTRAHGTVPRTGDMDTELSAARRGALVADSL